MAPAKAGKKASGPGDQAERTEVEQRELPHTVRCHQHSPKNPALQPHGVCRKILTQQHASHVHDLLPGRLDRILLG